MQMNTYNTVLIESDKVYKPEYIRPIKGNPNGRYNMGLIHKFLVLENTGASNIKLWTAGVDVTDDDVAIDIPTGALIAGNEYDLTIGKITFSGDLKILGYQLRYIPTDFPDNIDS